MISRCWHKLFGINQVETSFKKRGLVNSDTAYI